jgi:hypothetical protein
MKHGCACTALLAASMAKPTANTIVTWRACRRVLSRIIPFLPSGMMVGTPR